MTKGLKYWLNLGVVDKNICILINSKSQSFKMFKAFKYIFINKKLVHVTLVIFITNF